MLYLLRGRTIVRITTVGKTVQAGSCVYPRLRSFSSSWSFSTSSKMVGWNNPLPIEQAQEVELRKQGPRLGGLRKKVYPVAGPLRGHSSETLGPWTLPSIFHPRTPFDYKITISTPRVLEFPTLRVLYFPPTPPHTGSKCALISTTSAVTISPGKGSGNLANASASGNGRLTTKRGA